MNRVRRPTNSMAKAVASAPGRMMRPVCHARHVENALQGTPAARTPTPSKPATDNYPKHHTSAELSIFHDAEVDDGFTGRKLSPNQQGRRNYCDCRQRHNHFLNRTSHSALLVREPTEGRQR